MLITIFNVYSLKKSTSEQLLHLIKRLGKDFKRSDRQRCYEQYKEKVEVLSQLPIEDYDAELEIMHECGIFNERINKIIKGKK